MSSSSEPALTLPPSKSKSAAASSVQAHLTFASTIFTGAMLLFTIQPLIARMIVPLLGGAPAVWIVCSLCFQTLLLLGYAYTHFVTTRLPVRAQVVLQLLLVGSVFLVMPISVNEEAVAKLSAHPTFGVIFLLVRTVGLPFFVLSTSSPLLQRWFAELGERDPYHLYAASNAGSMLALLGYPLLVEPLLAVRAQSRALHTAFAIYTVLVVICAIRAVRPKGALRVETTPAPPQIHVRESQLPSESHRERWRERIVWIALSFAPSSLLLGATEYITTDIASVPLLWVLPLALYLLSFIIAFAKKQVIKPTILSRGVALIATAVTAITLSRTAGPAWLIASAHVLLLFVASIICHRGLAERRPPVTRLTEFYLLLSIGGVLGGAFNGLLAPLLFDDLVEYPLAIGLACLGRAAIGTRRREPSAGSHALRRSELVRDIGYGVGLGLLTYALVRYGATLTAADVKGTSSFGWMFGIPIVVTFFWSARPVRYAFAVASVLLAGMQDGGDQGKTLWADRGFFGVLKVTREREGRFQLLVSGRSMQGKQALDPDGARTPLAYYYPTGPAGDVLGPLVDPKKPPQPALPPRRIGVIGLGIGSLAAYARAGDSWTFFEINPSVVDVARHHFTYLKIAEEAEHAKVDVEIGDARLRLREGSEARFDVLVLDAFSSDAVPIHLVTREALAVYRRALKKGGLLLAHISNNHVHLPPVFSALARDVGMVAIARFDRATRDEQARGKDSSDWVLLTDSRAEIDTIVRTSNQWHPLTPPRTQSVWTDDYANVLRALRF